MIGERIGNYVVTQKLGEGGMGAVYLAEHPQIGKRVALKVLHGELTSNQEIATRFFHEAKAVNDIGHPNIVDIQDFGMHTTSQGGVVYIVMELLSGSTLAGALESGPLPAERAIPIALQIADALAASHERGIVHRDLKPENVMLVARGRDRDFVKLLDFGIAKLTHQSTMKTRTGMLIGTPTYMSPEQCEGKPSIDHRTDIYALGIVIYEMLTGRVPFDGSGYTEILMKHLTAQPAPISSLRPGVPPYLEQLVLKALQKRPEDRFSTMRELAQALGDPQRYVDAHGGLGKFLPAQAARPSGPDAATRVLQPMAPAAPPTTTLGQGAAEVSMVSRRRSPSKLPLVLGALVGIGAIAAGIVLFAKRGGDDDANAAPTTPAAAPAPAPAPAPTPTPTPAPAPAPPPPAPAPTPAAIKLSFETTPAGASVYYANEPNERCKTPCGFDVPRADANANVTVKRAGFVDVVKTIKLDADARIALELAAKPRAASSSPRHDAKPKPKNQNGSTPVGDNVLDPFDNK